MGFGYNIHNQTTVGYRIPHGAAYPSARDYRLDSAADWMQFSFLAPPGGATLNKVLIWCSAVYNAPLTDSKLQCEVWSDSSGVPSSSLATSTTVTAKPGGSAWVEWTGFTQALTGGAIYHIVVKNIEADPTAKYPTFRLFAYGAGNAISSALGPLSSSMSTDSGSTWTGDPRYGVGGFRLEYSDGFSGFPISDASSGGTYPVYGNREQGAYFTTPASGQFACQGVIANVKVQGSPGNGIKFRLYKGTTLVDTTKEVLQGNIQTTLHAMAMFSAQRVLDANTVYRVTMMHSGAAGSSSAYYALPHVTLHDSADSRALCPLKGWQNTYTTDSTGTPPSFTETATVVPCIGLLLDTDGGEIYAAAGGSGGGLPIIGGSVVR